MAFLRLGSKIICPVKIVGNNTATLKVIPSTISQTIISTTPSYSRINVQPVTKTIDNNIKAQNIKEDTSILGVAGNYQPSFIGVEKLLDNNGELKNTSNFIDLLNIDELNGDFLFAYAYYGNTELTGKISFLDVSKIIGSNVCLHMFDGCTNITSVEFNNLSYIPDYPFGYAFANCTSLEEIFFPALKNDSFGSSTQQFYNMLYGVTGCTVHFPAALEEYLSSLPDVQAGFGGTDTVVVYDLPSHNRISEYDLVWDDNLGKYIPALQA